MGFDISYHPVKESDMRNWFFDLDFTAIADNDFSGIEPVVKQYQLDEFFIDKYKDILAVAVQTPPGDSFENSYGYYMAVIQGLMDKYFYTRGSAYSFMMQDMPYFKAYTKPWADILTDKYENPTYNQINQNYSSGVYIPADMVVKLLHDYNTDENIKRDMDNFYSHGRIDIFMKALEYAMHSNAGILEATEVVEPNPLDLNQTVCYSNLLNCDIEGAILYQQAAQEQLREYETRENLPEGEIARNATYQKTTIPPPPAPKTEKKGFFKRLFG
ncbi:hypothetical protein GCM10023149_43560 [Mucilaginibacter gynuensis]|uniref:Uncharacterized protein n=1 Tax=Mucilaginibacter gynuensis TaxID=1302236 RepID=A0ABP8H860_9SPHI